MIEEIVNATENTKLYKSKHIGIATFLGGPLAAGYLMYENFKALQRPISARNAIIIGSVSTIILFVTLFSIPEDIIDKIPSIIIPSVYTAIIYYLVQKYQGDTLEKHEKNNNPFFSIWRAIGIGLISLIIIAACSFAYLFLITDNEAYEKYDAEMKAFYENEENALKFYDNIENKSDASLLEEVTLTMIPKWEENIEITEKINETEDLPSDLFEQNNILLEYSKLRLKLSFLIKESIMEQTDKRNEIGEIEHEIDSVLNKLK